jgi:ubiquinone/menaquinone biosynthesis C-methylase UbiE
MVTTSMGGVLPEQPDPTIFQRVLDVGCGTGGWLIEAAKVYPSMRQLVGVDRSGRLLDYARAQAGAQQVHERVEFHLMDALRMLEFPKGFFDLVNLRFGMSFLRQWDWPKFLQEFQRVTRPGGTARVTEPEMLSESNSPAHMRLQQLNVQAAHQAGLAFASDGRGVLSGVPRLLRQHGLEQVQTRVYTLEYRSGTPEGQLFVEDSMRVFRTALSFLRKWTHVPDDYEAIYQQMLAEIHQPDFVATWKMVTAWGIVAE